MFKKFTLIFLIFIGTDISAKEKLVFVTDEWCPYNCSPEDKNYQGLFIEVVKEALFSYNVEIEYKILPWARAVKEVEKGRFHAVLGASSGDVKNGVEIKNELVRGANCFFTEHDNSWEFKNLESLKSVYTGIINGYTYGSDIDLFIKNNKNLFSLMPAVNNPLSNNLKKLKLKRIKTILEDKNVMSYVASKDKFSVKNAGCFQEQPLIISFSPKFNKANYYRDIIDNYLIDNKNKELLKKLYQKYNIIK